MNKTIFFLLMLIPVFCKAQFSGKAEYELILGDDPRFSFNQELTNMLFEAQQLSEDLTYSLYFDQNKSYFEINELPIDTRKYFPFFACVSFKPDRSSYSDLNNLLFTAYYYDIFFNKNFIIEDKVDFQWKLTNKEKIINNLKVIKAYGLTRDKIKIEAWFTPEIPVSTGPENFMGLPGLILELQIDYAKYICKKIDFTNQYNSKILKPTEAEVISYEDYDNLRKKMDEFFKNQ